MRVLPTEPQRWAMTYYEAASIQAAVAHFDRHISDPA